MHHARLLYAQLMGARGGGLTAVSWQVGASVLPWYRCVNYEDGVSEK